MERATLLFVLASGVIPQILCFDGFSGFANKAGKALASNKITGVVFCKFYECCNDDWIPNNITGLT